MFSDHGVSAEGRRRGAPTDSVFISSVLPLPHFFFLQTEPSLDLILQEGSAPSSIDHDPPILYEG